jgi:hypothetical protein
MKCFIMTWHIVSHPFQDLYSWVCKGKELLHGTSNFEIRDKNELAFATGEGKMQALSHQIESRGFCNLKLRWSWDLSSQDILCDEIPASHLYTILIYGIPHGSRPRTTCQPVVIIYLALYQPLSNRDFLSSSLTSMISHAN